jgi:type IV pilus assembly protein PilF
MLSAISMIKSYGLILTGLLLLSSCSSREKKIRETQADLYFSTGTQSLVSQEYTQALTALLKANELRPGNDEILNNLGMAYYFKGQKQQALKFLKEALSVNKDNSDVKVNLASIYFRDGDYQKAEALYKKVLEDLTYDKQARTYYNLGAIALQGKKDVALAQSYFKKSIKEDDNYCPSYFQLGLISFNRRQFNSALKSFKEASLGTCVDSPAPHYYQGLTYIELKRFNEARMKFDEIDTKFKKSAFAVKARTKMMEVNDIEARYRAESHASGKALDAPEF